MKKGFTWVELMIVIFIGGIALALIQPLYKESRDRRRLQGEFQNKQRLATIAHKVRAQELTTEEERDFYQANLEKYPDLDKFLQLAEKIRKEEKLSEEEMAWYRDRICWGEFLLIRAVVLAKFSDPYGCYLEIRDIWRIEREVIRVPPETWQEIAEGQEFTQEELTQLIGERIRARG